MTRTKKKLPKGITLRKDGRYQGRFTFKGKRYTFYDKDIKVLNQKLLNAKYELEHGVYGTGLNLTLNEWFNIWLHEYKMLIVKNSTLLMYNSNYERYVKENIGEKQLKNIKTIDVQKLFNEMRHKGLSIGTIQIVNSILNNVFTHAIQNDFIEKNPCKGVILANNMKKEPRVLTEKEQKLFLECIKDNFYEPLYLTALATGLRIGELTALTWDDIDFKSKTLIVNKTLLYQKNYITSENGFQLQAPKSKAGYRQIPLIPDIVHVLKIQKELQLSYKNMNSKYWNPILEMGDLVFTTRNGTPIQEVYMVKRLDTITKRMNQLEANNALKEKRIPQKIKRITPHTLRHSFATRAFENGMSPKTVQALMGHSALNITMDLYTHVTNDVKNREMKKMEQVLKL